MPFGLQSHLAERFCSLFNKAKWFSSKSCLR